MSIITTPYNGYELFGISEEVPSPFSFDIITRSYYEIRYYEYNVILKFWSKFEYIGRGSFEEQLWEQRIANTYKRDLKFIKHLSEDEVFGELL